MNPIKILELLAAVGPVIAALPAFRAVFDDIVGTFGETDQTLLKDAYADLMAANDATHARLQDKLRTAGGALNGGGGA